MSGREIQIGEIVVDFPYEPYDIQVDYMTSLITCFNEKRHGVLESPTGTGKTLCLLSASLAWLGAFRRSLGSTVQPDAENDEILWGSRTPKVIYASRTHSQLRQVMKQFNLTNYKHVFRPTVLGSRDHLCVNPALKKQNNLSMKNAQCSSLVKTRKCRFFNAVKNMLPSNFDAIEEVSKPPEKATCCPYYACREIIPNCDIIFMPYNYLLDLQSQKSFKFNLKDSVIIIDEGHNIAKVCEEAACVSITSSDLAVCLADLDEEMKAYAFEREQEGESFSAQDLASSYQAVLNLETAVSKIEIPQNGKVMPGAYMFQLLDEAAISIEKIQTLMEELLKISDDILEANENSGLTLSTKGKGLRKLADNLFIIYSSYTSGGLPFVNDSFKVFIEHEEKGNSWKQEEKSIKINYWCFNPSFSLKKLLDHDIRSLILTSGTMSPIDATVKELGLQNVVTLENGHIIRSHQILLNAVPRGPTGFELKCTFENRNNGPYWRELGMTIENVSRLIPHGLLVFFPSYSAMKKANEEWSNSGLMRRLSLIKPLFTEPSNKEMMAEVMADYSEAIDRDVKGAILMAVCRGKVSEGLDFSGKYARGVIITGIPFAPIFDAKVKLKKEFMDLNANLFQGLSGEVWYQVDAMRAVNQAIGRVIRHSTDYGVVILCDSRFEKPYVVNRLPKWLKTYLVSSNPFGKAIVKLKSFFKILSSMPTERSISSANDEMDACCDSSIKVEVKKELIEPLALAGDSLAGPSGLPARVSKFDSPDKLSSLVSKAEDTFNIKMLFNPAVIETYIGPDTEIDVQPAKRRKIKVIPHKTEELNNLRKDDIKNFILDVKCTLDADGYANFAFIMKKYRANNDFNEVLSSLIKLFLSDEQKSEDLFKGCARLFPMQHKQLFEKYLIDNGMSGEYC